MSTTTLPDERTSDKGATAYSDLAKTSPGRTPIEGLLGDLNNRLGDPSLLTFGAVAPNPNGNGRAASKARARSAATCQDEGITCADKVQTVDVDRDIRRVRQWKICDLKPYPRQEHFFPAESEEADLELAADMKENDQKEPIDILPVGTILGGHRRVEAAKRLGWETVKVVVHTDLANDEAAAEAFFINDNYTRRQLTDLQKARCAARRIELAKQGKVALPQECNGLRKTRDKIGKLLGISGREADRYLRVLKTPIEVQHACDAGHLTLKEAGKVAGLSEEEQKRIAEQIREQGPEEAKAIVKSHLPSKAATPRGAQSIWCNLYRALVEATKELPGNVRNIGRMWPENLELIERAEQLLEEVREHGARYLEDDEDELDSPDTDGFVHENKIVQVLGREPVDTVSTEEDQ